MKTWPPTRHSGLDPESKPATFVDSGVRRNDKGATFTAIWWGRGATRTAILGTAIRRPTKLPRPDYIGARNDGGIAARGGVGPCGGARAAQEGRGEVRGLTA